MTVSVERSVLMIEQLIVFMITNLWTLVSCICL